MFHCMIRVKFKTDKTHNLLLLLCVIFFYFTNAAHDMQIQHDFISSRDEKVTYWLNPPIVVSYMTTSQYVSYTLAFYQN